MPIHPTSAAIRHQRHYPYQQLATSLFSLLFLFFSCWSFFLIPTHLKLTLLLIYYHFFSIFFFLTLFLCTFHYSSEVSIPRFLSSFLIVFFRTYPNLGLLFLLLHSFFISPSRACFDCPWNKTDCDRPECVAADGERRMIFTVNKQLPGPSIQVRKTCTGKMKVRKRKIMKLQCLEMKGTISFFSLILKEILRNTSYCGDQTHF